MGCAFSSPAPVLIAPKDHPPSSTSSSSSAAPALIDWASLAPAHADLSEHLDDSASNLAAAAAADDLMEKVFKVFESPSFAGPPPPFHLLGPADADWSGAAPWCLQRIQEINAVGGPRMKVVHWKTLEDLGRIPRWPDDASAVLDLEDVIKAWVERQDSRGKIDDKIMCITMFSHRWTRPALDPAIAHPDSPDGLKAQSLAQYGHGAHCGVFPNHLFEYFFWIDFAGVNQQNRLAKTLGVSMLPLYVAGCSEICFFYNEAYEGRAWMRLERVIGYAFNPAPMFVLIDGNYIRKETPSRERIAAASPGCFSLDDETGGLMMAINDPLGEGAGITDPADQLLVEKLLSLCLKAPPLNASLKESFGAQHEGLDLGQCKFAVDVEHYRMDCEAALVVLTKREQKVAQNHAVPP